MIIPAGGSLATAAFSFTASYISVVRPGTSLSTATAM
jgi:hypothetical protein